MISIRLIIIVICFGVFLGVNFIIMIIKFDDKFLMYIDHIIKVIVIVHERLVDALKVFGIIFIMFVIVTVMIRVDIIVIVDLIVGFVIFFIMLFVNFIL